MDVFECEHGNIHEGIQGSQLAGLIKERMNVAVEG